MSTTFDTLKAARNLEAAGMDRAQAEAIAEAIRAGQGELATKADLAELRQATKVDLYQTAIAIILGNAAITFGLLKLTA